MKTNNCTVKIETNSPTVALRNLADVLECRSPYLRSHAAEIVKNHGFGCHVGGRHVAILSDTGSRLAIVTSKSSDWN